MTKQTSHQKASQKKLQVANAYKEELAAINNIRTSTRAPAKTSRYAPTGISKRNRTSQRKRYKNYQEKVWPGWRESDGITSPVISYKRSDVGK